MHKKSSCLLSKALLFGKEKLTHPHFWSLLRNVPLHSTMLISSLQVYAFLGGGFLSFFKMYTHTHTHTHIYTWLVFHISLWFPAIHWPSGMRCLESYFLFEVKSLVGRWLMFVLMTFQYYWIVFQYILKIETKTQEIYFFFLWHLSSGFFFQLFNFLIFFIINFLQMSSSQWK
jgi:hypothetical protein